MCSLSVLLGKSSLSRWRSTNDLIIIAELSRWIVCWLFLMLCSSIFLFVLIDLKLFLPLLWDFIFIFTVFMIFQKHFLLSLHTFWCSTLCLLIFSEAILSYQIIFLELFINLFCWPKLFLFIILMHCKPFCWHLILLLYHWHPQ